LTARFGVSSMWHAGAALLLAVVLATGGAAAAAATPLDAGFREPIHAFEWPASSPDDPLYTAQTDLSTIGVPAAWLRSTGAPGVVVAVLDTGIDATHPEFAGRLVPGYDATTGVSDSAGDFSPTDDPVGHGTHVSGTIAAAANNSQGIAGVAPNVSIMPVKVLDATGDGDFEGMVLGMNWAISHGARIITMSLGGTLGPIGVANIQPTFDAAYAAGAVVVAASGNDGSSTDEYPCNFVHVICVGSTSLDGSSVSSFSTRTTALTLVAPGEHIVSTVRGGTYGYGSGTSMATPHVTGAVALMRSLDPAISVDQVVTDLTQTARPLVSGGWNPASGYGLLQVGAALDLMAGGTATPTPMPTPSASPAPSASPTPTPTPTSGTSPSPGPDPAVSPMPTPIPTPVPAAPVVLAATPRNGTRNVARSTRPRLTFSVPMAGISSRTITLIDLSLGRHVRFRISYSASSGVATISPTVRLGANHSYRVIVGGITSAAGGIPLRRTYALTFRTGYR
jgi:subtilisin family serine protease